MAWLISSQYSDWYMVSIEEMLAVSIIAIPVHLPSQTLNERSPGLLEEEGHLVQEHTF